MADKPVASEQLDDVELTLRMMDGDEEALSYVIRHYGPKVMGALRSKFGNFMSEYVLEDAIHRAAFSVWRNASKYDDSKGSLGGLFYKCAVNEVINILREGEQAPHVSLDELDEQGDGELYSRAEADGTRQLTPEKQKLYKDLYEVIAGLPGHQRVIMEADLAAGCDADTTYLAESLHTSNNSIYVSRNKAREKVRQEMKKRGHFR